MSYKDHLSSSVDLVTTYEEIKAGFVALALERNRRATPFVEQARTLKTLASRVKTPRELLDIHEIKTALLSAAGISDKASNQLQETDRLEAIEGLIKNFLEPAGQNFIEELVYRFLLTRGDTLGGSMRNVGGVLAERKFARALISTLTLSQIPYKWLDSKSKTWINMSEDDTDIELTLKGISWNTGKGDRTFTYNINVPIVKKNIDICLFGCSPEILNSQTVEIANLYIALGELKGGIDPAGADEHWKTANSALGRIRTSFGKLKIIPNTFFVGAAIAKSMAEEIWEQLETKTLTNAANLTKPSQLTSVCLWLINL